MNKKIKLVIIIFIAVLGFVNINFNNIKNNNVSSLTLANIEVLADSEGPGILISCYNTMSSSGEGNLTHVTYCPDCSPHLAKTWKDSSGCLH